MWRIHTIALFLLGGLLLPHHVDGDGSAKPGTDDHRTTRLGRFCSRVPIDDPPSWVTSGVFDGKSLVMVDVADQELVRLLPGAAKPVETATALSRYIEGFSPTRIRPKGEGEFVVELAGGRRFVKLGRNLGYRGKADFALSGKRKDGTGMSLIDWIVAGQNVFGYADIEGEGTGLKRWRNGLVRFPIDHADDFTVLRERPFPDPSRIFWKLTYPFLASPSDRTVYAVLFDTQIGLYKLEGETTELKALPTRVLPAPLREQLAPILPDLLVPDDFVDVMREVERSTIPAGLYSFDKDLFLLFRVFKDGSSHWWLSKISRGQKEEELLWTVPIPSRANHLTVVPGPEAWAFLEKGPVKAWGRQDMKTILYVSSSQMRAEELSALCN
jgi:hypothetical protein